MARRCINIRFTAEKFEVTRLDGQIVRVNLSDKLRLEMAAKYVPHVAKYVRDFPEALDGEEPSVVVLLAQIKNDADANPGGYSFTSTIMLASKYDEMILDLSGGLVNSLVQDRASLDHPGKSHIIIEFSRDTERPVYAKVHVRFPT